MGSVICDLPAADIDRLEGLWRELLAHHLAAAPHLAALGPARDPADSWRVRRAQYLQWLAARQAAVLVAQDGGRLVGYAMIRVVDAPQRALPHPAPARGRPGHRRSPPLAWAAAGCRNPGHLPTGSDPAASTQPPRPRTAGLGQAYYGSNYRRLRHVKAAYDPGNLFPFHQSLPPR